MMIMENKINIAELLKDCPKGMELYSPIYGLGILTKVTDRIHVKFPKEHNVKCFRPDGKVSEDGEIMLYPKGKTTWEGFVPPCEFKDGDIVSTKEGDWIGITTGGKIGKFIPTYCVLKFTGEFEAYLSEKEAWGFNKLATEEEKQKLFNVIKSNGFKWNAETKTLENLIEPKFKVGDKIKSKISQCEYTVLDIRENVYILHYAPDKFYNYHLPFCDEYKYDLIPDKFDINTLKPFDKVLVRQNVSGKWSIDFFGGYDEGFYYTTGSSMYVQCIPYEGNEHLLGTTEDCDDYYKV